MTNKTFGIGGAEDRRLSVLWGGDAQARPASPLAGRAMPWCGPWPDFPQLNAYGLRFPPKRGVVTPIDRDQFLTALGFLQRFRPIKRGTVDSYRLKHDAERWGARVGLCAYVANGALLAAAIHLELAIDEYTACWPTSPNAKIGISMLDYKKFMKEEEHHRHVI